MTTQKKKRVILVDMDETIADNSKQLQERLIAMDRKDNIVDRKTEDSLDPELDGIVRGILAEEGWYCSLKPIEGAIEALHEMAQEYDIFICTSPFKEYKYCVPEKFEWVEKYLGKEWTRRLIIAKDKTMIKGDILIDDRVQKGIKNPEWTQIYFTQPYNADYKEFRLSKWNEWRDVIPPIISAIERMERSNEKSSTPELFHLYYWIGILSAFFIGNYFTI